MKTQPFAFHEIAENLIVLYRYAHNAGGSIDFDTLDTIVARAADALGPARVAELEKAIDESAAPERRDAEGETLARWLVARYGLDAVHYGEGHIEIGSHAGGTYAYVDVQDDGTCDVAYYESRGVPENLIEAVHVDEHDQIVAAINAAHARATGEA
jgi:hypothetical protein